MELAERMASRGHHVSFVSTPRNIARLPAPVASAVELVALPLPRVDGLADGAESTNDVPDDEQGLLMEAFDGLAAPFADFLAAACADDGGGGRRRRPDWVIADSFHHWAAPAAARHGVPCVALLPSAAVMAAWVVPPPATSSPSPAAAMPSYEWEKLKARFLAATSHGASSPASGGMSRATRCSLTLERCTLAAMRSCVEWEPEPFRAVAAGLGKPLVPLGLLPPSPAGSRRRRAVAGEEDDDSTNPLLRWLDAQPPSSVLYVALGSEVPLRVDQVHELALGLELAGARFLWALRKPRSSSAASAAAAAAAAILPPGFQERTASRGVVTMGWAPQIAILEHAAVGAFLTHCGQNSLVEGISAGNPLVMLPIAGDQGPNARLMEARKVGLQVARDGVDGSFDRHGVAAAVRAAIVDEETRKVFVANALKLREVVADEELHERYIDEFIHQLRLSSPTYQA
uniref:Glycosyltransferase n=1 Tax=Oryza nivara TaxID=4536 RepID=A0A0E0JB78_ORYNI